MFCCLWRNVEASCHKHFIVFSGNQHRRLLPAMCHNLRDGGRCPPATAFTTPIAALTQAIKPDIGSESRFLPTPPAFDAPVRGGRFWFPSEYCYAVWRGKKLEWRGYPMVKIFWWYVYSFWHYPRTWQTHKWTDGQTDTAWRHRSRLHSIARQKN